MSRRLLLLAVLAAGAPGTSRAAKAPNVMGPLPGSSNVRLGIRRWTLFETPAYRVRVDELPAGIETMGMPAPEEAVVFVLSGQGVMRRLVPRQKDLAPQKGDKEKQAVPGTFLLLNRGSWKNSFLVPKGGPLRLLAVQSPPWPVDLSVQQGHTATQGYKLLNVGLLFKGKPAPKGTSGLVERVWQGDRIGVKIVRLTGRILLKSPEGRHALYLAYRGNAKISAGDGVTELKMGAIMRAPEGSVEAVSSGPGESLLIEFTVPSS